MANIYQISISEKKGVRKKNVDSARFVENFGIEGDAHGDSTWHRQISLLAVESIESMKAKGFDVKSGDFAENLTTVGLDLLSLPIGSRLKINNIELVISQIGKICHHRCAIYHLAGDCVMPKEGIFATVVGTDMLNKGDKIEILPKKGLSVGVITLSDKGAKGKREDQTGPAIIKYLNEKFTISSTRLDMIEDDKTKLEANLKDFADTQQFDVIITNGSTGVSSRDIAPDVTLPLIERRLLGFEEIMRAESYKLIKRAIISRAVVGIRGKSLIINLPGSPKAAIENLSFVADAIEHTVAKINDDPEDCGNT